MFKYTESEIIPNNIFVFGCGGTGSRMIPPLLQLIKSQSNWILNPSIYLIDGDEVEEKNCSRQNFITMDVHQNKAEVLATRYSRAFDMQVKFYPKFFDKKVEDSVTPVEAPTLAYFHETNRNLLQLGDLSNMVSYLTGKAGTQLIETIKSAQSEHIKPGSVINSRTESNNSDAILTAKSVLFDPCVVILCVDSAEARRNILYQMSLHRPSRKVFVIDAGNEDIFGQVMFYRLDHRVPFSDWELVKEAVDVVYPIAAVPTRMSQILGSVGLKSYPRGTGSEKYPYTNSESDAVRNMFRPRKFSVSTSDRNAMKNECEELKINALDTLDFKTAVFDGAFLPEVSSVDASINILPCPDLFYDNLQDGEGTRSCADLDQTLAINNLMAAAIINVVQNLIYGLAFDFHTIRISLNGGYHTEKMTPYWLRGIVKGLDSNYSSSIVRRHLEIISKGDISKEEGVRLLLNFMFNKNCKFALQNSPLERHLFSSELFKALSNLSENKRISTLFSSITGCQPSEVSRESVEKSLLGLTDKEVQSLVSLVMVAMDKGSLPWSPANFTGNMYEEDNLDSVAPCSILLFGEVAHNPVTMTYFLNQDRREMFFHNLSKFIKRGELRGEIQKELLVAAL